MKNKKISSSVIRKVLLMLFVLALLAVEIAFRVLEISAPTELNAYNAAVRFIGGAVCIIFMYEFSFNYVLDLRGNRRRIALLAILPAFVVAVNNFPFVSFLSGDCTIKAGTVEILVYALFCLSVGFFEELAFRGCVLMFLLRKRCETKWEIFAAIFLSSVVFGLIHLVNLFTSSPAAVLLQIGYSALIGGLCSLVLLTTGNIWVCVALHSIYNFAGGIVPEFGSGAIWTAPEVTLTAVLAIIVTVYSVWLFIKLPVSRAKELYKNEK